MSKRKSNEAKDATKPKQNKTGGHWSMGLLSAVNDPDLSAYSDDLVHIIKDKYPKAKYHYLVMPKAKISSLKSVTDEHADLLKHMEDVALELIKEKLQEGNSFKLGYHADPSMSRLHLHVISEDMQSDCLKTKKHWNSFHSDFFLKSKDVRANLEQNGKVVLPSKEDCKKFMDSPLKCHKCDVKPKNMPELKKHIASHFD